MREEIIYTMRSPYRESLNVRAFHFGGEEKSLAVVGAMRGNEVQQMYICARLVRELKRLETEGVLSDRSGITVIPCINYYSMNIGKRFWAMDNTDINRMFPGYDQGETTQRIAEGVFEKIKGYEYGIQLASFYQEGSFVPHVKIMETGFTDTALLKWFGLQYGIIRKPRPYDTTTLNYNWQIWDTKAFSVFSNSTDKIDRASAEETVLAIFRFISNAGLINKNVRRHYDTDIIDEKKIKPIISECGGLFLPKVHSGEHIEKGELIGLIEDPFDCTVKEKIISSYDGVVFFCYNRPLINQKTTMFKIVSEEM